MNANEVIANLAGDERRIPTTTSIGPVLQRRVPVGRPPRGARRGHARPAARARRARARPRRQGRRVRRRRQGRPHAPEGRVPVTLGQEFPATRPGAARRSSASERRSAAGGADPARRHGRRHRPQHPPGVRRRRASPARRRPPASDLPSRATRSRRRATATRWSSFRRARRRRRVALRRSPTTCAGWAPARAPGSARSAARAPAGLVDHAGQGQPGDPRGGDRSARR